jgi:SAM-dependent methyltransferase
METLQKAKPPQAKAMAFRQSRLAHRYLDGLKGIEIGGAAHNQFGLQTLNIDNSAETVFKAKELSLCGTTLKIDLVAQGDELPLATGSQDFVLTSHVLEHFLDPIKALKEWYRVVRDGGYILAIVPHKERTFDKDRPRTPLAELIGRHEANEPAPATNRHFSVWIAEDIVELVGWLGWKLLEVQDPDDKVGNGFTIVIKVQKHEVPENSEISLSELEFLMDYSVARDLVPPRALERMISRMMMSLDRQRRMGVR